MSQDMLQHALRMLSCIARRHWVVMPLAWLACVLVCGADTVKFKGVDLEYSNAEVTRPDGETGDIVFRYTNTVDAGTLKLPSYAQAWVLVVGGGGAGGTIDSSDTSYGWGGGGGAGEFIENKSIVLEGGNYCFSVGAGGAEGTKGVKSVGASGKSSTVTRNAVAVDALIALGGGGGGASSEGASGSSGGGGSYFNGEKMGGASTKDKGAGNAGGKGAKIRAGAGGGGAGSVGADSRKVSSYYYAGKGGDGLTSAITNVTGGASVYYAGGGGGSASSGTRYGKGGAGGGGRGGSTTDYSPIGGTDGLGGGGGGGNYYSPGAKGGDGVVIIRLSEVLEGDPVKPVAPEGSVYGGTNIIAVAESLAYSVSGQWCATNAGSYTCTATLRSEAFKWSDGTKDPVVINWSIAPLQIEKPTPVNFTYDGTNKVALVNPPKAYVFTPDSVTNAVDAGSYSYTVSISDTNYAWKDAAVGEERSAVTVSWSIAPLSVDKPVAPSPFTYDGTNKVAILAPHSAFVFSAESVTNAVHAGDYSYTVTLKSDNYIWKDAAAGHERDACTIAWQILPAGVPYPVAPADFVYDGENKVAITSPLAAYVFTSTSVTNATNAGVYTYTVSLISGDYSWQAAPQGKEHDPYSVSWRILPMPVEPPAVMTNLLYNGEIQNGYDESAFNWEAYDFDDYSTPSAEDVGEYDYTLVLNNDTTASNYVWLVDEAQTYEDQFFEWSIAQTNNAILNLSINGWKVGTSAQKPTCSPLWGTPTYAYANSMTAEEKDWSLLPPQAAGIWYVRATVAETTNYKGAVAYKPFVLWDSPETLFRDHVEIKIAGTGAVVSNMPILVSLDEGAMPGFLYSRAGSTGKELAFLDEGTNTLYSYAVDEWNTDGTSLLWVKIPELPKNGMTILLYWCLKDGQVAPTYEPEKVWSDYVGVWHFGENVTTANATTNAQDSSGNGYDAQPKTYRSPVTRMVSSAGAVGRARTIETANVRGTYFEVANSKDLQLGSEFTLSFWAKLDTLITGKNYMQIASRKASRTTGSGFHVEFWGSYNSYLYGRGSGSASPVQSPTAGQRLDQAGYVHYDFVYKGTSLTIYVNGNATTKKTGTVGKEFDSDLPIIFGCSADSSTGCMSFWGKLDEVRLRRGSFTEAELAANYKAMYNGGLATPGFVVRDGRKVDYWSPAPTMSPTTWEYVKGTPQVVTTNAYALKSGGKIFAGFYDVYNPSITNAFAEIGAATNGTYDAVFRAVDRDDYEPISTTIRFVVIGHSPTIDIMDGTYGASGRILLMNNDKGDTTRPRVDYQGWYDNTSRAKFLTQPTFWEISSDGYTDSDFNRMDGTNSVLWTANYAHRLWHLYNCRHGNTYELNDPAYATGTPTMKSSQNYLPWESGADGIKFHGSTASAGTVGQVLMRNTATSCVYSPCYTNGVGTIYFDAVNGWTTLLDKDNNNMYGLTVEVATETIDGSPLTEETSHTTNALGVVDTWYGNIKEWVAYTAYPVLVSGESLTTKASTKEVLLDVTTGGAKTKFYRIYVPVDTHAPMRFRIRRSRWNKYASGTPDRTLILLDNIIVSYPAMSATLESAGWQDLERTTKKPVFGEACATMTPFPSTGDSDVYARGHLVYSVNDGDKSADPLQFIKRATLHYRWRYLNQLAYDGSTMRTFSGDQYFQELELNPNDSQFRAVSPLNLPNAAGDVEFWYETRCQAPYYQYVDYSGVIGGTSGVGLPSSIYTEEKAILTNRVTVTSGQPSMGSDQWFFRLRDGKSDYEGIQVVLTGALEGEYPMELVEDGMWRAVVKMPRKVTGDAGFRFKGYNLQTPGDLSRAFNTNWWGAADSSTTAKIPGNGTMTAGGKPIGFTISHSANYLEFKMSEKFNTWSVSRAEYQDFNEWHDAYSSTGKFWVKPTQTNGVDVTTMSEYTLDATEWDQWSNTDDDWNETFQEGITVFPDAGFPLEVLYQSHKTPGNWSAENVTFVSQSLQYNNNDFKYKSGMAGKFRGQGLGVLEYAKVSLPPGLDQVTYSARVGQSIAFESMRYNVNGIVGTSGLRQNYLFMVPTTMSHSLTSHDAEGDMAVGAAVSVFAYYCPGIGCYEFRAVRKYKSTTYDLYLIKWSNVNGVIQPTTLCAQNFTGSQLWTFQKNTEDYNYYGMFISVKNTSSGTQIYAGLSADAKLPTSDFSGDNAPNGYRGLYYCDNSSPHTFGSYGVAAKDCPAVFMRPRHYDAPLAGTISFSGGGDTKLVSGGKYFVQNYNKKLVLGNTIVYDMEDLDKGYFMAATPTPLVAWTNNASTVMAASYHGLRMPPTLSQKMILELKAKGSADWVPYATNTVSGYSWNSITVPLHFTGDWYMRLKTGAQNIDVVIDDVKQTSWEAPDHEEIAYQLGDYIYTQGLVKEDSGSVAVTLQPARGVETVPMSIRSPVLDGLGRITFTYDNADDAAEIWVQMTTNNVEDNYYQYNYSVDEGEDVGEWQTVAKYGSASYCDDQLVKGTVRSGTLTCYLGIHTFEEETKKIKGFFRLVVPTHVIQTASAGVKQTTSAAKQTYGQIRITGVVTADEPEVTERAWRGWNMRALGDATDSELRMYLRDTWWNGNLVGTGLSGALNNSINDVEGTVEEARSEFPTIWSPTLGVDETEYSGGVGSVALRARLYGTDGAETTKGGLITLWGASDAKATDWTKVAEFEVTESVFRTFEWSAKDAQYRAVKFTVNDPSAKTTSPSYDRVELDTITICEKVNPSLSFLYARPFRSKLMDAVEIEDVMNMNEQPLAGESWGVQTKLKLQQMSDEIDTERGFEVYMMYTLDDSVWGYERWKETSSASSRIQLTQVGEATNLVFRSVGTSSEALVKPVEKGGSFVQFQVIARYWDRGGVQYEQPIKTYSEWTQPDWFYPIDRNKAEGGDETAKYFSPYTILDTVSPGRAWINEVNWNDGEGADAVNQFFEVCVPAGVDLTGWYVRATDLNLNQLTLARFGYELPAKKTATANMTNGFEFVFAISPNTDSNGGLKDKSGNRITEDGVWSPDGTGLMANGTLNYTAPFQFELVRPSGVIEHQVVIGGTNVWSEYEGIAYLYDATNLVAKLAKADLSERGTVSPLRFWPGDDTDKTRDGAELGAIGVVGGNADANPAPGAEGTWRNGLAFTPGRLNVGQTIPAGWFLAPNGTNAWVYLNVLGSHLLQNLGGDVSPNQVAVLPIGVKTNVVYTAAPWYELARLDVNGKTEAEHQSGTFTYTLTPTGTTYVTAQEGADNRLVERFGLTEDNAYTPSVLRWLNEKWPNATPDDIKLANLLEFSSSATNVPLSLTAMYWLDIPAVPEPGEAWTWRVGVVGSNLGEMVQRQREYAGGTVTYENRLIRIKSFISNGLDRVYAPQRLQGLDYTKSDTYSGGWTSVTFKIRGILNNPTQFLGKGYLPFNMLTFGPDSFDENYESLIELIDPFSTESPGYSYGWASWPRSTPAFYKWSLDTDFIPETVETLRAEHTWGPIP